MKTELFVYVGDAHVNSRVGLMPPVFTTKDGQQERHSAVQEWIWERWVLFWEKVERLRNDLNAPVAAVANGDMVDLNRHNPAGLVCASAEDALAMAEQAMRPATGLVDHWRMTRGTPAHVGEGSHLDAFLGQRLGAAVKYHHRVKLPASGVTFDVKHEPGFNNRVPWTMGGAANRLAVKVELAYLRRGLQAPDVALRGHVHNPQDSGKNNQVLTIFAPSWQLTDDFAYKIGEFMPLPVGGLIFECRDGKVVDIHWEYSKWEVEPWEQQIVPLP